MPLDNTKTKNFGLDINANAANIDISGLDYKVYSSTKIASTFYGNGKVDLGVLPPVVRYITPNFLGVIVERPPTQKTIVFRPASKFGGGEDHFFTIPIPWTLYSICTEPNLSSLIRFEMYFRNTQVWTTEDPVFYPCVPNVGDGGFVCYPHDLLGRIGKSENIAELVNTCIEAYWSSYGNLNITHFYSSHAPKYILDKMDPGIKLETGAKRGEYPLEFLRAYESITVEEALEIEYKAVEKKTVQNIINDLDRSSGKIGGNTANNLPHFFNMLINS